MARIALRLQAAGLPLPDPAPHHGRANIQMTAGQHRKLRHDPRLRLRTRDRVEMFLLSAQGWMAPRLAVHLDVQGVGYEGGGVQGNQRFLTFYLTSSKFHADRLGRG